MDTSKSLAQLGHHEAIPGSPLPLHQSALGHTEIVPLLDWKSVLSLIPWPWSALEIGKIYSSSPLSSVLLAASWCIILLSSKLILLKDPALSLSQEALKTSLCCQPQASFLISRRPSYKAPSSLPELSSHQIIYKIDKLLMKCLNEWWKLLHGRTKMKDSF